MSESATSSRAGARRKRSGLASLALRLGAWLLIVLLAVGVISGVGWGFRQVLFSRNPHFLLRDIRIRVNGRLRASEVEELLDGLDLKRGETNLFAVDLGRVRTHLEASVLVKTVSVARRLPGTLEIEAVERSPVAQLLKPGGRLLDSEGRVLPERNDLGLTELPVVTGIRSPADLIPGAMVSDEMIAATLRFLSLAATESYGKLLDVAMVQLDYSAQSLQVHLRERGTFRAQAKVVLPVKGMSQALRRVELIALDRLRGRQTTSFIDATYEINVPVRP